MNPDPFLGFNGLMQSLRIPPARHDAAGQGIHNQNLSVLHHIVPVTSQKIVGPQRQIHMVLQLNILQIRNVLHTEELFHSADTGFCQENLFFLLDHDKVPGFLLLGAGHHIELGKFLQILSSGHTACQCVTGFIEPGRTDTSAGDNQRRSRVVDQYGVHLIDDAVVEAPLNHLILSHCHVVPQIVKSQLTVGHICNIAAVGSSALGTAHAAQHRSHRQTQKAMDLSHLIRVAFCQIIIDRDHMNALTRQCVEVGRQRRHQCLALAGAHLGDATLMQHNAANHLRGKMLHTQHPPAGLPHHSKGLRKQIIQRLPLMKALPEFIGLVFQRSIAQRCHGLPIRSDPVHNFLQFFQFLFPG